MTSSSALKLDGTQFTWARKNQMLLLWRGASLGRAFDRSITQGISQYECKQKARYTWGTTCRTDDPELRLCQTGMFTVFDHLRL